MGKVKKIGLAGMLLSLGMLGCSGSGETGEAAGNTVRGKVVAKGKPVAAARVTLTNGAGVTEAMVLTGAEGQFAFSNISDGQHNLSLEKQSESGQVYYETMPLMVNGDVLLATLVLPEPPVLLDTRLESTDSAFLSWNTFGDPAAFREYKLFRKKDPGIDESHGDLIYVGTKLSDTVFSDAMAPFEGNVYYRLYVMNEYGKAGGSNILTRAVPYDMARYLPNASFESGDAGWSLYDAFKTPIWANFVDEQHYWLAVIDSGVASAGKKSLRLTFGKGQARTYGGQYTTSKIGVSGLKAGQTYQASFMLRFASCKATSVKVMLVTGYGENTYNLGLAPTDGDGREWRKITTDFTTLADYGNAVNTLQIDFGRYGIESYETDDYLDDTAWVDDIQIHPKP